MNLVDFLTIVVRLLEEAGIPYMVTGSVAAAYYANPRATQDIDLVIEASDDRIDTLVDSFLAEGMYVSREAAQEAFRTSGQFNAVDQRSGWKADLIFRRERPFSVTEFSRRRTANVLGVQVALTSPEDLVIAKLEWSVLGDSELQRSDLAQLLESAGRTLDRDYVEHWIAELQLEPHWRAILDRVGDPGKPPR